MNVITRSEARDQGLKYYFTGKPCKRNHVSIRFTSNGTCSQCHEDIADRKLRDIRRNKIDTYGTRVNSLLFGRTFYSGAECPACGGNKRYTKSKDCVKCATHKMNQHEMKMMIIRNPAKPIEWYVKKSKRSITSVYYALTSLNIPRRTRPEYYVG